jgi:hypothetical protein
MKQKIKAGHSIEKIVEEKLELRRKRKGFYPKDVERAEQDFLENNVCDEYKR